MLNQKLTQEQRALRAEIAAKAKAGELKVVDPAPPIKRRRWDQPSVDSNGSVIKETPTKQWDEAATPIQPSATPSSAATPGSRQWEETPGRPRDPSATPGSRQWAETPAYVPSAATPGRDALAVGSRYRKIVAKAPSGSLITLEVHFAVFGLS